MDKLENKPAFSLIKIGIKNHPCICIASAVIITLIVLFICFISALSALVSYSPPITEYCDVADYGKFDGSGNEEFVNGYIQSFFPKEIDDTFSNVTYSYNAVSGPSVSFSDIISFQLFVNEAES